MYRHIDAALVRAAAWNLDHQTSWPDLVSERADPESWRAWLQQAWQKQDFAGAVTVASPDLASRVEQIRTGRPIQSADVRRTVLAVLRYLLRARTRATPFGLFAGVAPARIGATATLRVGNEHHATSRTDAASSTALIDRFEQHPALRTHLVLTASTLAVERDGHVVIEHLPSGTAEVGPQHVHVRLTAPVRAALQGARAPIGWGYLAAQLADAFPSAPVIVIDKLISGMVEQRLLVTSLRPAMTVTDPLAALHGHLSHLPPVDADEIRRTPRNMVDLRVDWKLTVPEVVATEAAAAARALTRLAPRAALTGWAEWHGRFLERYGPQATVPVLEAVDALGYPSGFLGATTAPTTSPLPERDGRLIRLAHSAGMQRRLEVELDDAALEELAATHPGHPVQPSTELTVRIHATSLPALQGGEFTLHVVGVARSAGATAGRFLDLLGDTDRDRMTKAYAELPAVHRGALLAQISSPPLSTRAGNVARAPQAADLVISLGEHHSQDTGLVPVTDLAVTADAEQLHLVSLSRDRPLHTLLLNAVDLGHHSHPLARFLAEAPVALAVPCTGFLWGIAPSHLPFLPALRYGRTILSPARWRLAHNDLPTAQAPWPEWDQALTRWRRDVRLPERVHLTEADQRIALDLAESSHRAVLRAHLARDGTVLLHPASEAEDLGWTGGRAHEIVIPLVADQNRAPVRTRGRPVGREHGHLPGCDNRVQLHLYGHRERQDPILTRHLSALLSELGSSRWWFVRYRDSGDHLRLRLNCKPGALGAAFESLGEWARHLRRRGLITHASVETYLPETARFGGPTAIGAAERFFATDSAAVVAQLAAVGTVDAGALTSASMVDLATGLLGDSAAAMRWLIEHTRTSATAPDRVVYRQAVDLVNNPPAVLGGRVATTWSARREALIAYRGALLATDTRPEDLLPDLLHLHHARMHGPDLDEERRHLHLARAAALSWTARARRTP
ncbi:MULTISPECIES: lantibiotic dehydratase [Kitasatospora]|uniref:lantibiotic dehydratase n=1 Tax=Kitasatospora TaxID=2063 RepID=UPI00030C28C0|nr:MULTISPECIES: lantibiotic dehydratase [Kitasatospora]